MLLLHPLLLVTMIFSKENYRNNIIVNRQQVYIYNYVNLKLSYIKIL